MGSWVHVFIYVSSRAALALGLKGSSCRDQTAQKDHYAQAFTTGPFTEKLTSRPRLSDPHSRAVGWGSCRPILQS